MLNKDIVALYKALANVEKLPGAKFAYAIAKNSDILKNEVKAIKSAVKSREDHVVYEKELAELSKKYAKKDQKGKPIIVNGNFLEIDDTEGFEKEHVALKEKHKIAIEYRETQLKDYEKLLEQKNDIKLHLLEVSDLPKDITGEQLKGIYAILK